MCAHLCLDVCMVEGKDLTRIKQNWNPNLFSLDSKLEQIVSK